MCQGFLRLMGLVGVIMAVTLAALAPGVVAGQTSTATAQTRSAASAEPALTTPWGDPDLQGIWNDHWQTSFERPAEYEGKAVLTDEERAELDRQRAAELRMGDRKLPQGSEADVSGAYNAVFIPLEHTGPRTSLIVDPEDGKLPALTPEAQAWEDEVQAYQSALVQTTDVCKQTPGCDYGPPSPLRSQAPPHYLALRTINRADGPEDRSLGERCIRAVLPDFGGVIGVFQEIIQTPGAVAVFYDTGQGQGWQRIIPVTDTPPPPPSVTQWAGVSRGRWEGDTLVVEVTNFSPKMDFQRARGGGKENMRLIERFRRVDEDTMEYFVTVDDPTIWTRPWTVQQELTKQSTRANRIYREPRCHEGNYGLVGLLWGARVEEQEFAEGGGPHPATRCIGGRCSGYGSGQGGRR